MKHISRGPWILSILLFAGCFFKCCGKFDSGSFDRKLVALFKVINYIDRRPYQMNADATFGITLAQANIAATLLHKNARFLSEKYLIILRLLLTFTDLTRRKLISNVVPRNKNIRLLHETLNNPELWMKPIDWKTNGFRRKSGPTSGMDFQEIVKLTMQGTPGEEESDECLNSIVEDALSGKCVFPEKCLRIIIDGNNTRGYPLTHRLLIVQVAEALNCEEIAPSMYFDLIKNYCSAILQDLLDIMAAGFPYNTRDLMMEEVLLCGMEGFSDFIGAGYENLILSWAHSSGCFSSFGFRTSKRLMIPSRRSSVMTDYGCDSHASGLGAGALSLYIRENVESAFQ